MNRPGTVTFHRPARAIPAPVEHASVTISSPPTVPQPIGNAVWQVLAPVLGSAGMVGFALMLGEPRYMIMAGMLAGVMLVSGIISRVVQVRSESKRRERASQRYHTHLAEVRSRLDRSASTQRSSADQHHPPPTGLLAIVNDSARVWERRPEHVDFLTVRLGLGSVEPVLTPSLEQAHDPLSEPEPLLMEAALAVRKETLAMEEMPISVDLRDVGCLAIVGDRSRARDLVCGVLAQLSVLRAPIDLGILGWASSPDATAWDWVKWLPHTRATSGASDDGRTMWTTQSNDLALLLEQIAIPRLNAVERRRTTSRSEDSFRFRQLIMLLDGYRPDSDVGELEIVDQTIAAACDIDLLAVCLVDGPEQVPSRATARLTLLDNGTAEYVDMRNPNRSHGKIIADHLDAAMAEQIARTLAPLRIRANTTPASVDSAGLLDLLAVSPSEFDPERAWLAGTKPLTTPIGIGSDGEPFELDLREASAGGMGPHGILIGATGSGKSELLRTLVLGLAVTNAPDELSFVFADFKGGATFAGLDALPHTAGSITNIESDPELIDRMQEALRGEMERRQRILREHRFDRADEYRQHRRTIGRDLEPLPALVVVVDEFGELLANRPEFVELFASIGRTGRSLGVHLLLSSQRLDEGRIRKIEGHLRYRICLRTFSAEESIATIGSRASFDLPPVPGLGHVAVDGALTQFKAGMVNRPIRAMQDDATDHNAAVRRFGLEGPTTLIGSTPTTPRARTTDTTTEMQLITDALQCAAVRTRQVWLPPLNDTLEFSTIHDTSALQIVIGETDLPTEQQIVPSIHDFSGTSGNLAVVGGPRSGKSSSLGTIISSLAYRHAPQEVSIYAIDLGGGTLHRFDDLPHVGAVFGRSNREEVPRLIRQLGALIEQRVELFRHHRLTSMSDFSTAREEGLLVSDRGHVFLVIDQWGSFTQEFGHDLTDAVTDIVNGGLHYGVHVILTASRWQDIRMSLRDNIGGRLELRLTDPIESEIDRRAAQKIPTETPGRAIDKAGRLTQVMLPPENLGTVTSRWAGHPHAPRVTVLPTQLDSEDVAALDPSAIGVEEHGLAPWKPDLATDPHFVIVGDGGSGKTTTLRGLISSLSTDSDKEPCSIALIDYRTQLVSALPSSATYGVATSPDSAAAMVASIVRDLSDRSPTDPAFTPKRDRIVLIVDDYDLVVGGSANPLGALIDMVPLAQDLGFHLVIARKTAGLARSAFEPIFQRLRELSTPTLIMDGDPAEGPVAGVVKASRQPVGRGVLVERSKSTLIQVADFRPRLHLIDREVSA